MIIEKTSPDIDNTPNARKFFTLESPVRLDVEVSRRSRQGRHDPIGPYIGLVGFGSRGGLSLDEAELFFRNGLECIQRARAEIEHRNSLES